MTTRRRMARCIEKHEGPIAQAMVAWLAAGAQAAGERAFLPDDVRTACRAVVRDLVAWLREDKRAWYWPRESHPWWWLSWDRARYLACSAVQEYLRSSDLPDVDGIECIPEVTELLSRYFLHTGERPLTLDSPKAASPDLP